MDPPLRSGGLNGIRSWPGIRLGGGIGRLFMYVPVLTMTPSLFVPRSVGLSANGFWYSGGNGGVKNERAGGEYDGMSPGYIGIVG